MKIYLACTEIRDIEDLIPGSDILEAFPYIRNNKTMIDLIPTCRNFILDSGVFTMINSGKRFNIDEYLDGYAAFIKEHKIKQYIELDVDQIYGVEETRRLRDRLENKVGYPSIPVWHTIRGKESFIRDCKDYNYIALGYFLTEGFKEQVTIKYAKAFVNKAHSLNCRIHGLGFTRTMFLKDIPFDSVDSSTWSMGKRYGNISKFDRINERMVQLVRPKDKRMKSARALGRPNFIEWKKFQDFAYENIPMIWK